MGKKTNNVKDKIRLISKKTYIKKGQVTLQKMMEQAAQRIGPSTETSRNCQRLTDQLFQTLKSNTKFTAAGDCLILKGQLNFGMLRNLLPRYLATKTMEQRLQ